MQRPLFILAGNGPYLNRGCEAIVRGTVEIIRKHFENPRFLVASYFLSEEAFLAQRKNEFDKDIEHVMMNHSYEGGKGVLRKIKRRVLERCSFLRRERTYSGILSQLNQAQVVLSVGGDNYSLDYGTPRMFTDLDDLALRRKKKIIIWGASVGPFDREPAYEIFIAKHLKSLTAIFSRESYTHAYLKKIGVSGNVYDVADPAFLMKPLEPRDTAQFTGLNNTIGLNFSPLMARYVCNGDENAWRNIARQIIIKVKQQFGLPILLIPHVCEKNPNNNDYLFMKTVVPDIPLEGVSVLPPVYSSQELKWIISKLCLFAGARTHATIAALSSCIPTISFSYSIKALGINQDIFNSHDYCLKPQELNPDRVCQVIGNVLSQRLKIRDHLSAKMPDIFQAADRAGEYLKELLVKGAG